MDGAYLAVARFQKPHGLKGEMLVTSFADEPEVVLAPGRALNEWFLRIVRDGTGRVFEPEHNRRWLEETRPILEAFFHARYFLDMAVRYGGTLEAPPRLLPSGWAAFLYLYDLR